MSRPLALLALLLLASGCTPTRSSIQAPYRIDGREYTAPQLETYANKTCRAVLHGAPPPPHPFTTDGCSLWRDGTWQGCCIKHDVAYWCGVEVRKEADQALRACVREASSATHANVMYGGVRVGGWRFWPFPWRFGYGRPWPAKKK
ncbi:MAG TPA: hypothetical protein VFL16_10135 [Steroidobacteraceae bacterium]|nr:hypothetical protein [Steroidobacteraceae bacterium]